MNQNPHSPISDCNSLRIIDSDKWFNAKGKLLPQEYRGGELDRIRLIIDYIAGMMDSFAIAQYKCYFGSNVVDVLY